jgi:hypothetical protein
VLEFYSGAAGPSGRFTEGFSLRRLHAALCWGNTGTSKKIESRQKGEHGGETDLLHLKQPPQLIEFVAEE